MDYLWASDPRELVVLMWDMLTCVRQLLQNLSLKISFCKMPSMREWEVEPIHRVLDFWDVTCLECAQNSVSFWHNNSYKTVLYLKIRVLQRINFLKNVLYAQFKYNDINPKMKSELKLNLKTKNTLTKLNCLIDT